METKKRMWEESVDTETQEAAQILVDLPRLILVEESQKQNLKTNKSSPSFLPSDHHNHPPLLLLPSDANPSSSSLSSTVPTSSTSPTLASSLATGATLPASSLSTASKDSKLKAPKILRLKIPKRDCHYPPSPPPPQPTPNLSFSFVESEAMVILKPSSQHRKFPKKTKREECSEGLSNHIDASSSEIQTLPSSFNESCDANLKPPEQNYPKENVKTLPGKGSA